MIKRSVCITCLCNQSLLIQTVLDWRCRAQLSKQTLHSAFFHSQERPAVPALWLWDPKMLCPLLWPLQNRLMLTSKELIPLSESHMTCCCSGASAWTCAHAHYTPVFIVQLHYQNSAVYWFLQHIFSPNGASVFTSLSLFISGTFCTSLDTILSGWITYVRQIIVRGRENIQSFIG